MGAVEDEAAPPLPTSRWRAARAGAAGRGAADRVRISHAQARTTLGLALAFLAAAAVAVAAGGERWLALHLFLTGGVALAISGVSLMLTVTWSAAPAPPSGAVAAQRAAVALGAAGVTAARHLELADAVTGIAGSAYLAGLVGLGALLVTTVRRGVERRFDVAVVSYVAAITAALVAVAVGIAMAVDAPSAEGRATHVTLNLLGFVGLTIAGTLPFFAATVGRMRMAPWATPRRLLAVVVAHAGALTLTAVGLATGAGTAAATGLVAYAVVLAAVAWLLPRPGRRQVEWAGPRLFALWLGLLWWVVALGATAVDVAAERAPFGDRWLLVLVVAAYAQVLWGSLAYLLPMLRGGGHQRLGEGFAATRSWFGLGAVNAAGLALTVDAGTVAAVAGAAFVLDAAWRALRLKATPA